MLGILLMHELGHFWAARYYQVDASLPYFLPVPVLPGTFGAFIRIRSAIVSKRSSSSLPKCATTSIENAK